MTKIAINGFGRIGRLVFRAIVEEGLLGKVLDVVAVNDIVPADNLAYLLKYDSIQGRFKYSVSTEKSSPDLEADDILIVDGHKIKCLAIKDGPAAMPWKDMGVEYVLECTGLFTDADKCRGHITAGAKKVVISAPGKKEDVTVVMGVNHEKYDPAKHNIISNASCTTNCLAPVAKILLDQFGIVKGLMTTVHAYTNDQQILDLPHKDLRRARAASLSMIPTTTGAAKAVSLVLPQLKGKLDGLAVRVPTPNVSLVDLVVTTEKDTSAAEVNAAFKAAAGGPLQGILEFCELPLVSRDFNGNPASSIVDGQTTTVIGGNMVKVMAWYDNEWGYSNRVVDLVGYLIRNGL
jgi:glyceraldehyde 3-phosphate dehydrogenase